MVCASCFDDTYCYHVFGMLSCTHDGVVTYWSGVVWLLWYWSLKRGVFGGLWFLAKCAERGTHGRMCQVGSGIGFTDQGVGSRFQAPRWPWIRLRASGVRPTQNSKASCAHALAQGRAYTHKHRPGPARALIRKHMHARTHACMHACMHTGARADTCKPV